MAGAEPLIRLAAFAMVFAGVSALEHFSPWRRDPIGLAWRWLNNLGLFAIDTALVRILFPLAGVGLAGLVQARGLGLLNLLDLPTWVELSCAVLALDLAIYGQHVLFHRIPLLWRLHRVHHADLHLDVTSGVRFHPAEILISMAFKFVMIALLGAAPLAVLAFEVLLNAGSMFSHANTRLPPAVERTLRWLVVTPDMHRVHHSIIRRETDSNFGFNSPWWDRLFGTYCGQPEAGHDGMTIGILPFRERGELRLDRMLLQPFRQRR